MKNRNEINIEMWKLYYFLTNNRYSNKNEKVKCMIDELKKLTINSLNDYIKIDEDKDIESIKFIKKIIYNDNTEEEIELNLNDLYFAEYLCDSNISNGAILPYDIKTLLTKISDKIEDDNSSDSHKEIETFKYYIEYTY